MYHPWREMGENHPDWDVRLVALPDGVNGCTDVLARVILIDRNLDQAGRRATLAHELLHVRHGHTTCEDWEEEAIERAAARSLIPLQRLVKELLCSDHLPTVADELWVDVDMLGARLSDLAPSERAEIQRAFAARDNEGDPSDSRSAS